MDRRRLVLVLCCLAQFMVILDVSIVNVALPSISADLGFSGADLQWVVNAYTLTFAGFLLLGGRAADLLGHRKVFVAGLLLFAAASLAGGLAPSQGVLVAARAAAGPRRRDRRPGDARDPHHDLRRGRRAQPRAGRLGGDGRPRRRDGRAARRRPHRAAELALDPLRQRARSGWPLAAVAVRVVADVRRDTGARRSFDLAGALTVTAGLVVLTYGIVRTEQEGWTSARTLGTLAAGLALLGAFLLIEGRFARAPLVPLRTFRVALADGRQRRRLLPRRLGVRHVVLRLALPAGRAGLHADRGGPGLPAHDRGDHPDLVLRRARRRARRRRAHARRRHGPHRGRDGALRAGSRSTGAGRPTSSCRAC